MAEATTTTSARPWERRSPPAAVPSRRRGRGRPGAPSARQKATQRQRPRRLAAAFLRRAERVAASRAACARARRVGSARSAALPRHAQRSAQARRPPRAPLPRRRGRTGAAREREALHAVAAAPNPRGRSGPRGRWRCPRATKVDGAAQDRRRPRRRRAWASGEDPRPATRRPEGAAPGVKARTRGSSPPARPAEEAPTRRT